MHRPATDRQSRAAVRPAPSTPTRASDTARGSGTTSIADWSISLGASPIQMKALDHALAGFQQAVSVGNHQVYGDAMPGSVQRREAPGEGRGGAGASVHGIAAKGVAGGGAPLPHADRLSAAFGRHDISGVRAHLGGNAQAASRELGAHAYTSGQDIAFGHSPDLHLAAHEAAHVVQQKAGVSLAGGVGQAGDAYERHADEVADAVVQGKSAEPILDRMAGASGASATSSIQREPDPAAPSGLRRAPGGGRRTPHRGDANQKFREGLDAKYKERDALTKRFFSEPSAFDFWASVAKEAFRVLFENRLHGAFMVDGVGTGGADAAPAIPGLAVSANQAAKAEGKAEQAETFVRATFPDASGAGVKKALVTDRDLPALVSSCFAVADKSLTADERYRHDPIFADETNGLRTNGAVRAAFEVNSNREIGHYTREYEAWRLRAGDEPEVDMAQAIYERYDNMPTATVDLPRPSPEAERDLNDESVPEETVEQAPIQRKERAGASSATVAHEDDTSGAAGDTDDAGAAASSASTGTRSASSTSTRSTSSAARAPSHGRATSTYDGGEIGPNEDDAEFLAAVAKALDAEAEQRGRGDGVQAQIAARLRAEAGKVRDAMGGGGDWRRYVEDSPWSSRDVRSCVDSLVSDGFPQAFDAKAEQLVRGIKLDCMALEPLYATLVTLRESVRKMQDVFEDVADYLELIGYVEQLKSIGDWIGLAATRGQSGPNPYDEAGLFLTGSTGGTGAGLARALAHSKLVAKMGEHKAALACFADGGDQSCIELARGLDGTLREIAKLSDRIEAKYKQLADMQRQGVCSITNDPLAGCQ